MATYLDPDRESNKDYTNIKKVLDEALAGYAKSGGTFKKEVTKYGANVFIHLTKFACVKQPPGGQKDAYYALHHMQAFVRDLSGGCFRYDIPRKGFTKNKMNEVND